jgi:ABC-2 type transport system permease protein
MPIVPPEIMWSKIIANGLVILLATDLSILFVVQYWLQVPIAGSITLFLAGATLYTVTVATLGILMATVTSTMGQFALLAAPTLLIIQLLSGGATPMESEPVCYQRFPPGSSSLYFQADCAAHELRPSSCHRN